MTVDALSYVFHGVFAALWTGSVLFVALAVLPVAQDGAIEPDAFGTVVGRLQWITRASALVTLATGAILAEANYTAETLTGTESGYLVLAMVALWLALAAVIEVGSVRANRAIEGGKKWQPARDARPFYLAGAVLAVGLLLTAGLLGANRLVGVF